LKGKKFELKEIERQHKHTDVLITVETLEGEIYKIIVEDKTHTKEHGKQLTDYVDDISKEQSAYKVRGIYYKTGFQSDLSAVKEAGYMIIDRKTMLDFMRPYVPRTSNLIFLSYYNYWNNFQEESEKYRTTPISKWEWKQINGFYDSLKHGGRINQDRLWMNYGYVAQKDGGFDGLWLGLCEDDKITVDGSSWAIYLQLEIVPKDKARTRLCLKLCANDNVMSDYDKKAVRNSIIYDENWNYRLAPYNFSRPNKLSLGKHMTVGIYNADLVDDEGTVSVLKNAIEDYSKLLSDIKAALNL
jgi:hypothetical protein